MSHPVAGFPFASLRKTSVLSNLSPTSPKPRTTMRTLSALLAFSLAVAPSAVASSAETDATRTASYLKTLPHISPPVIDQAQIVTLISLLKQNPKIALAPIIRQRLTEHLAPTNIAGEVTFFADAKDTEGKNFERPYGYTWLFKIYGELASWNDPDAKKLAANLEPLNKQLTEKYILYLKRLPYPIRVGTHPSSALTMNFALDSTDLAPNPALKAGVDEAALRFFAKDKNCTTAFEPGNGDFLSPCLTEAMLMSRVMDQTTFVTWLDTFLPAVYSPEFQVYAADIDTSRTAAAGSNADAEDKDGLLGSKAHLIGLAFQRAAALLRVASALPPDDPRVPVYQRLAAINAQNGFRKIGDAGYLGQHWLATSAVLYMQAANTKSNVPTP